jgi:polar amino acid transport system substrate-binding protein
MLLMTSCNPQKDDSSKKYASIEDLASSPIGIFEGTVHDQFLARNYPNVEIKRYNSSADMMIALKTDKTEAALVDAISAKVVIKSNPEIMILSDTLLTLPLGVGFHKNNPKLLKEFNQFLSDSKKNGRYDQLIEKWLNNDPEQAKMSKVSYPIKGKVIKLGVAVADLPYVAYQNGEYVGLDIDMIQQFALSKGYKLEITTMEFGSLVNALAAGKVDMISDGIAITDERKKQINFSDVYAYFKTGLIIRTDKYRAAESNKTEILKSFNDLKDKRIGVFEGTVHDQYVAKNFPKAQLKRFTGTADLIISVKTDKVDGIMVDDFMTKDVLKENPDLALLTNDVFSQSLGMGFNKQHPELKDEFNKFLAEIKASGKFDEIFKRWTENDSKNITPSEYKFDPKAKKLVLGITVCGMPFSLYLNENLTGLDIEIIQEFAKQRNYNLEIKILEFNSIISALASGKVDMIAAAITITPERAKQIDFSDVYVEDRTSVIVRKASLGLEDRKEEKAVLSFLGKTKQSFYNNIIYEKRYKLIIDGLVITMITSIFSVIIGTLFGAIVCFLRMSKKKLLSTIAKLFISIMRGTPVLVLLMIIYYIVFASININPVYVAIFAFGLNFAAYVSEMFRTGIEGVDRGQSEAGIALGFSKIKTFLFIVMPQATKSILPVYKGEMISLVKMTSIVGYIAVEDLTKAGDIIRSRTFDAFFPLLMVAVLYFMISWILLIILEYFQKLSEPKAKRNRS